MLKVIFNFIENKQELQNYVDDVPFFLNDVIKNNYRKLFENIGLEKIKTNINEVILIIMICKIIIMKFV
jgi:hypothetical protein